MKTEYNGGLNWDKLNNADYVKRNYSVPDYGVFDNGGNIHIKKSKRGTFTAAATRVPKASKRRKRIAEASASQLIPSNEEIVRDLFTALENDYNITL